MGEPKPDISELIDPDVDTSGLDWLVNGRGEYRDIVSAQEIFEIAQDRPDYALMCMLVLIKHEEIGHRKRRRSQVAAIYAIAFGYGQGEDGLRALGLTLNALGIITTKKMLDLKLIKDRLVYFVFEAAFKSDASTTDNSSYRYAYSLEHYLEQGIEPERVRVLIDKHGLEALYRSAVARNKLKHADQRQSAQDEVDAFDRRSADLWAAVGSKQPAKPSLRPVPYSRAAEIERADEIDERLKKLTSVFTRIMVTLMNDHLDAHKKVGADILRMFEAMQRIIKSETRRIRM